MWPIVTNGACIGERLLSARRGLAEVARRRLASGFVGEEAPPTAASANRSADDMLLTMAGLYVSFLMIVVATTAEEAGTIADEETSPEARGSISVVAARELKASGKGEV